MIPADRAVKKVEGGWFIPDARMKEILDALNEKVLTLDTEQTKDKK